MRVDMDKLYNQLGKVSLHADHWVVKQEASLDRHQGRLNRHQDGIDTVNEVVRTLIDHDHEMKGRMEMLTAKVDSMSDRLCHCVQTSPQV